MRWKRQAPVGTQASSDNVKNLHLLEGHSLVVVDDTLYVDGGRYFDGVFTGGEPQIYNLENNATVADDWVQNDLLYAFDLTKPYNGSTTSDFLAPYCKTIKKQAPASSGSGGQTHPHPLDKHSFIHVGGLLPSEPSVPFWGLNTKTGFTNSYTISDKKKTQELFNMYDGASTVSPDGKVYYLGGVDYSGNAPDGGARLAQYDLKTGKVQSWSANGGNLTVPAGTNLRGSSMVWLPYGEQGILVNIGGVIWKGGQNVANPMDRIMIFDIANSKWYTQGTTAGSTNEGTPAQRSHFCAVTPSPNKDRSSYEILFYGGYDPNETDNTKKGIDDFWALTVPTFQWSRYYTFNGPFGKYNRSCALIHDVFYGFVDYALTDGGAILSFWDVTLSGESNGVNNNGWGRYDPTMKTYNTPLKIQSLISGLNGPPAGWTPGLDSVFTKSFYDTSPSPSTTTNSTSPSSSSDSTPSPSSTASPKTTSHTGAIVGGVVGGVAVLALLAFLLFFFLRRRNRHVNEAPILPKAGEQAELDNTGGMTTYSELSSPDQFNKGGDGSPQPTPERVELYGSVPLQQQDNVRQGGYAYGPGGEGHEEHVNPASPTTLGVPELPDRYSRSD